MRCAQQCGTRRFQSTTPLGRRHFFGNIVVFDIPISIHDSARKATTDLRASCNDIRISIHASAREATSINHVSAASTAISIHASAREATKNQLLYQTEFSFQSTPPRGRRPVRAAGLYPACHFNPRLREGGDLVLWLPALCFAISIHASAREATQSLCRSCQRLLFQSTPPRGRRRQI